MKRFSKYFLSAAIVAVLSLGTAQVLAEGPCHLEVADEYTCYATGYDGTYCYYDCYCKVDSQSCDAALRRDGFEIL